MEDRTVFARGAGRELQVHLEQAILATAGVHFHAQVDLRLGAGSAQGVGRPRVFERQVADELGQDANAGHKGFGAVRLAFGGRVGVGHENLSVLELPGRRARWPLKRPE